MSARQWGLLEIILSGVAFGFLGVLGKSVYANHVTPFQLLAIRFSLAGCVMAFGLFVLGRQRLSLRRFEILVCLGLGAFGYAVFSSLFFTALRGLPASLTVLLLYSYPVMVSIGGAVFLGERLRIGDWLAMACVMTGLYWIVGPEWTIRDPILIGCGIGSAVVYSAYILISRHFLKRANPYQAACLIQLAAAGVLLVIGFHSPQEVTQVLRENWLPLLGVALVSTVLAMSLFLSGLRKVTSTETALFSTAEPMTGVLAAVLILDEKMRPLQWLGGALILTALVFVALSHRPRCELAA